jgi:hypothetical protein
MSESVPPLSCGIPLPPSLRNCPSCGAAGTCCDCYPEQYSHPLCGKRVRVVTKAGCEAEGTLVRVVSCRFGKLAHLDNSGNVGYLVRHCQVVRSQEAK